MAGGGTIGGGSCTVHFDVTMDVPDPSDPLKTKKMKTTWHSEDNDTQCPFTVTITDPTGKTFPFKVDKNEKLKIDW